MPPTGQAEIEVLSPQRMIDTLPRLLEALRQNGFDAAVDQYLNASDLVLAFTAAGSESAPAELCAALGGLLCSDREQQQRFPALFEAWFRRLSPEAVPKITPQPEPPSQFMGWLKLTRGAALRLWLGAIAMALLATAVIWFLLPPKVIETEPGVTLDRDTKPPPIPDQQPSRQPDLQLLTRPRQPPEPVVPSLEHYPAWARWLRGAWLVPVFLWLLALVRGLLLHWVVLQRRRERPGESFELDHLGLADTPSDLFSAPSLSDTWRHLREFRSMQSQRLNETASVDRTLKSGGYFRPVYRNRQVPPAYLLLVDRRHAEDHAAALADGLHQAMRRENLQVHAFYFAEDPRFSAPGGNAGFERGPAELASVYEDHGLFLVGDGEALFDPLTGTPQPWTEEFKRFDGRVLLTQEPAWRLSERARALVDNRFRLVPLTDSGVRQLAAPAQAVGFDDPRDRPTPRRFAVNPQRWLEARPRARSQVKAALIDLAEYLGREGFLLACATAAYPELHTGLTRALDLQLGLSKTEQALRLRKLARLPWYRAGYMPDYLRILLLRQLNRDNFSHVSDAYAALLEHRGDKVLRLPVAVPERKGIEATLKAMLPWVPHHQALGDRVFASVVRGRRPRRHEFALPRGLVAGLKQSGWRGLAAVTLAGLLLVPAAVWLNAWAWSTWLAPKAQGEAQNLLLQRNSARQAAPPVNVHVTVDVQAIIEKLEAEYDAQFQDLIQNYEEEFQSYEEEIANWKIRADRALRTLISMRDDPHALPGFGIAITELKDGNTKAAEMIFQRIERRETQKGKAGKRRAAEAARHLGTFALLHNPQKALNAYRRATDLDPGNADGWNALRHLSHQFGQPDEADRADRKVTPSVGEATHDKEPLAVEDSNRVNRDGAIMGSAGSAGKAAGRTNVNEGTVVARSRKQTSIRDDLRTEIDLATQDMGETQVAKGTTVGVLYPVLREPYSKAFDTIMLGIEQEIGKEFDRYGLGAEFDVNAIETLIQRRQNELILAVGSRSIKAANQLPSDLPIVVGAVLPSSVDTENTDWSGILLVPDPDLIFKRLRSFAPNITKVFVVYNPAYNRFLIDKALESSVERGIALDARPVADIPEAALVYRNLLKEIDNKTDAIWLLLDPTSLDTDVILPLVLQEAWERSVVTFSNHLIHTKRGALFSLYPDNLNMGKALAKLATSVLSQPNPPGFLTIKSLKIAVNMRTAKHLGIKFSRGQEKSFDLVFPRQ